MKIKGLDFILTCEISPEQYDIKDIYGNQVGYVRLRWGTLTCEYPDCGGTLVYSVDLDDDADGCFATQTQRDFHLNCIADKLLEVLAK